MNMRWTFLGAFLIFFSGAIAGHEARDVTADIKNDTYQNIYNRSAENTLRVASFIRKRNRRLSLAEPYSYVLQHSKTIIEEAKSAGIPPKTAFALVNLESNFNSSAVSTVGAVGLTQIRPFVAKSIDPTVTEGDLYQPRTNLRLGFQYLRKQMDKYDSMINALRAYHRGPTRLDAELARGNVRDLGYARMIAER